MKIRIEYDLPEYDPDKHDPDETFAFLTYRGVNYAASGLILSHEVIHSGKYLREGEEPSLFLYFCIKDNKLHLFVCIS